MLDLFAAVRLFHRRHRTISAMLWLLAPLLAGLLAFPLYLVELPAFLVSCVAIPVFIVHLLNHYELSLAARICAHTSQSLWQVRVNDVVVGELTDSAYASIQRAVFFDGGLYVTQLLNAGYVALRIASHLWLVIPLAVLWLVLSSFITATDTPTHAVLQRLTLPVALVAFSVLVGGLFTLTRGRHFGFVNHFAEAYFARLRYAVSCSTDGAVSCVHIPDNPNIMYPS